MSDQGHSNTGKRLDVLGEVFFGAMESQGWLKRVRERLDAGDSEEQVRELVKDLAGDEGLTFSRAIFPGLNRKWRRLTLRRLLNAVAERFTGKLRKTTLGDVVDSVAAQLGFDEWIADAVVQMAKTGAPVAYHPLATGRVFVVPKNPQGEDDPTVWAIATSESEVAELAAEFADTCRKTFPAATFSSRNRNAEAARYLRRSMQGASDEEIAEEELPAEELERLGKLGPLVRQARIAQEVDRIRKTKTRLLETLDKTVG
jgi:hypothetical protein